ncbi:MAG: hypothetical protein V3V47_05690 [Desulfobacteria bacterium]
MQDGLTSDNVAFTYYDNKADYNTIKEWYDRDVNDLGWYFDKCSRNYDATRQEWAGKTDDLKKNQEDAFPHQGASDTEVRLIQQLIRKGVALDMNALQSSRIQAYPRGADDLERASEVSLLLKWFRDAGVPNFRREMELASNYGKEKGIMATYVGWKKQKSTRMRKFSAEEIVEQLPEFAEILFDEDREEEAFDLLNQIEGWELNRKRFSKAMKEFRDKGEAKIPVTTSEISEADVRTFAPDADIIMPSYTTDPQRASHIHMRMLMTPQEILNRVSKEGWDEEWAHQVINNHTGMARSDFEAPHGFRGYSQYGSSRQYGSTTGNSARDIVEIIYTFQRLIDPEDNAEGIYYTVWSPEMGEVPGVPNFAIEQELMDGRKDYPFVITPISWDEKVIYDSPTWPELLRAPQKTQKVIRDSWIDSTSDANNPPLFYPATMGDLSGMAPGAKVAMRTASGGQPFYLPKPDKFRQNLELENFVNREATQMVGFDTDDEYGKELLTFMTSRLLIHAQNVLTMLFDVYTEEGPDQLYFRVTGKAEPITFNRNPDENTFDIQVSFNSTYSDPEKVEKLINGLYQITQFDQGGRVNTEAITDMALSALDPVIADMVLMPSEQGQQKIIKETTDDIAKMQAGVPLGAPNGAAQLRLQTVQDYIQSPTGQAKVSGDLGFQALLQQYVEQLEFQVSQQENAVIGRIGTEPAQMGNTTTQGTNNV